MTAEQIVQFLQVLKSNQIHIKGNGWITATCPLAPWNHKSGHDNTPSFGMKVNEGGRSFFNCFTCQTGSAEELLHTIEMLSAGSSMVFDFKVAHQILAGELFVTPLPTYEEFKQSQAKFVPWPKWWVDQFLPVKDEPLAANYLVSREVGESVWTHFGLRFDPKKNMIVAPYYTASGLLAGARGRSILPNVQAWDKHYDYTYLAEGKKINNAYSVWYNEQALNLAGPVVMVEGQFDCWRVWQVFPKVVAMLTAKPTMEKLKKLCYSPLLVHIPDNDETGQQSVGKVAEMCGEIQLPYRPAFMAAGPKDPDDCQVTYLEKLITTAVELGELA